MNHDIHIIAHFYNSFEMNSFESSLNSILVDKSPSQRIPICHVRDMESFYNPNKNKEKDIPCRFFMSGNCTKGQDCEFSHSKDNQKSQKFKT